MKGPNGQWAFMGSRVKQTGPHNPHLIGEQAGKNKAAFVIVTRNGVLRLFFQGPDGSRWLDIRGELDSTLTPAELLTHAAIGADKDASILIATHNMSKQVRTYRVGVDWSKRAFVIEHLTLIPDYSLQTNFIDGSSATGLTGQEMELHHLELLSPLTPDPRSKESLPALLLAFFCTTPSQIDQSTLGNEALTSIVRWELSSTTPTLHPSFSQLASRKTTAAHATNLQVETGFQRLPDVTVGKVIIHIQQFNLGTILAFCSSDGSIEFRSRTTLDFLPHDEATDRISSIPQLGFNFPEGNTGLYAAISPNGCAVVSFNETNAAELRLMQMSQVYLDSPLDDSQYLQEIQSAATNIEGLAFIDAAAGAFVIQFWLSSFGYGNQHDDLSATMQLFKKQHLKDDSEQERSFSRAFLSDMYRIIPLNTDYSGDIKTEFYLKNGLHQKTLSMQLSLGYWGEEQHRCLSSKVAFATLQLRWAALTFAMGLKPSPPGSNLSPEADAHRTETVRSFFGIIAWTLSLMNFIMDEIFTLASVIEGVASPNHDMIENKIRVLNSPALALLFVSQSRLLFKYNFRFFRGIGAEIAHRSHDPTWRALGTMFLKSPVPLQQFERVLADVENSVRHTYEAYRVPDADRKDIEKYMLVSGSVSPRLWPAVESLLTRTVKGLKEEVDVAELYFHDVSWLGLSDDGASDQWRKEHRLDIIRKSEVPKGAKVKQCTRCCSIMEDMAPPKGTAGWLINMWRSCVCGNWWMCMDNAEQNGNGVR
ncbi:MAG: hypothetical protein Q9220_003434 [cf. Caloplaca sp. 1 TL-2023]